MNIGIDIGNTIKGWKGDKNAVPPDTFRIITDWVKKFNNIYLISRVNQEQKDIVEMWLWDTDFFKQTGVDPNNLYFCWERKDKNLFVKALNITTMIDDRPEVMANMDKNVFKLLIQPDEQDLEKYKFKLFNTFVVTSWKEIETIVNDVYFAEL